MLANTENPQISGRSLERKTMPIFGQVLLAERLNGRYKTMGSLVPPPIKDMRGELPWTIQVSSRQGSSKLSAME
jgi:hypothetical protein